MVYPGRTYIAGRQKPLLIVMAIILLLMPFINTRLAEAVLAFCFGGVVPGTDIILSPDTVIWSVIGLLTSGAVASMWYAARRSRRIRMHYNMLAANSSKRVSVTIIETEAVPDIPYVSDSRQDERLAAPARGRVARRVTGRLTTSRISGKAILAKLGSSLADMHAIFLSVIRQLGKFGRFLAVVTQRGLLMLRAANYAVLRDSVTMASQIAGFSARSISASIRSASRMALGIWAWAEPRFWRFDAWLELQVRKLESMTFKK